jgi:Zn finger protein HypA/HybF involved in hydrogenase expression
MYCDEGERLKVDLESTLAKVNCGSCLPEQRQENNEIRKLARNAQKRLDAHRFICPTCYSDVKKGAIGRPAPSL